MTGTSLGSGSDVLKPDAPPGGLEQQLRDALAPNLLLVREIGAGGMARVFLAREPALKRLVAVKVMAGGLAKNLEARARFEREAQAVAALSHPNIVAVHSVGELADGTPYFVMQYVSGRSLAARVEEQGTLPAAEARRMLGEVAAALALAHKQGIIHRDIKPANILAEDATGRVLVSDFGIAAVAPTFEVPSARLTGTGIVIGTPEYMSPEQLLAEPVSEKTDVYGIGLLAHEILAGSSPFRGKSSTELIAAHLRDTPPRLSQRRPEVDTELDELIARCLAKDAAHRPSADEIARRLAPGGLALLEWPPPGLEKLHGGLRRLARAYWLGAGLLLAAMLVLVLGARDLGSARWSPVGMGVVVIAVVGTLALVAALRRTFRIGRAATRAVRLGYAWMTVLETLGDSAGDTGNLITGSREYAPLDPTERSQLRFRRVFRETLLLTSGVVILPLLILFVVLASMGVAPPNAIWVIVAIPTCAAVMAGALAVREQRRFARSRGRSTRAPEIDTATMAGPWYETFESIRVGQQLGRGSGASAFAGAGGAAVAAVVLVGLFVALLPVFVAGSAGPLLWAIAVSKFASTQAKVGIASVSRPFAVPKDPSITPIEAGRAFYFLQTFGPKDSAASPLAEREPPAPWGQASSWPTVNDSAPWKVNPTLFPDAVFEKVPLPSPVKIFDAEKRGFTPAEMAYLARLANGPQWRAVETIARARRMDYLGARYTVPFADSVFAWEIPIPRFVRLKMLAYASVSRSAYHLARGQRDSAEAGLRQMIGFGFTMVDDGQTLIEQLIGVVCIGIAREGLVQLYRRLGDPRGALLRAATDSAIAVYTVGDVDPFMNIDIRNPAATRTAVLTMARDTTRLRGLRWEMLKTLVLAPCTNARELLFGPDQDINDAFGSARKTWARFASDSALLDMTERSLVRMSRRPVGHDWRTRFARWEGALMRNPRVAACPSIFEMGG